MRHYLSQESKSFLFVRRLAICSACLLIACLLVVFTSSPDEETVLWQMFHTADEPPPTVPSPNIAARNAQMAAALAAQRSHRALIESALRYRRSGTLPLVHEIPLGVPIPYQTSTGAWNGESRVGNLAYAFPAPQISNSQSIPSQWVAQAAPLSQFQPENSLATGNDNFAGIKSEAYIKNGALDETQYPPASETFSSFPATSPIPHEVESNGIDGSVNDREQQEESRSPSWAGGLPAHYQPPTLLFPASVSSIAPQSGISGASMNSARPQFPRESVIYRSDQDAASTWLHGPDSVQRIAIPSSSPLIEFQDQNLDHQSRNQQNQNLQPNEVSIKSAPLRQYISQTPFAQYSGIAAQPIPISVQAQGPAVEEIGSRYDRETEGLVHSYPVKFQSSLDWLRAKSPRDTASVANLAHEKQVLGSVSSPSFLSTGSSAVPYMQQPDAPQNTADGSGMWGRSLSAAIVQGENAAADGGPAPVDGPVPAATAREAWEAPYGAVEADAAPVTARRGVAIQDGRDGPTRAEQLDPESREPGERPPRAGDTASGPRGAERRVAGTSPPDSLGALQALRSPAQVTEQPAAFVKAGPAVAHNEHNGQHVVESDSWTSREAVAARGPPSGPWIPRAWPAQNRHRDMAESGSSAVAAAAALAAMQASKAAGAAVSAAPSAAPVAFELSATGVAKDGRMAGAAGARAAAMLRIARKHAAAARARAQSLLARAVAVAPAQETFDSRMTRTVNRASPSAPVARAAVPAASAPQSDAGAAAGAMGKALATAVVPAGVQPGGFFSADAGSMGVMLITVPAGATAGSRLGLYNVGRADGPTLEWMLAPPGPARPVLQPSQPDEPRPVGSGGPALFSRLLQLPTPLTKAARAAVAKAATAGKEDTAGKEEQARAGQGGEGRSGNREGRTPGDEARKQGSRGGSKPGRAKLLSLDEMAKMSAWQSRELARLEASDPRPARSTAQPESDLIAGGVQHEPVTARGPGGKPVVIAQQTIVPECSKVLAPRLAPRPTAPRGARLERVEAAQRQHTRKSARRWPKPCPAESRRPSRARLCWHEARSS
jgi:hypothetical protein